MILTIPVYAAPVKGAQVQPASAELTDKFYEDFYSEFAPDALTLAPAEYKAAYDILNSAATRIRDGKFAFAAEILRALPQETEKIFRPVVTMREEFAAADAIRPFAESEARGELMKYHAGVWTSHPEFAEDFAAFSDDFALRASRRERTQGAPYIVDNLNAYGFTPKGEGGPQQAYLFLWNKLNAISKFADACSKLGLDYMDIPLEEYEARVAWKLADQINAAKKAAESKEGGRETWSELIEYYTPPEPEKVPESAPSEETLIPPAAPAEESPEPPAATAPPVAESEQPAVTPAAPETEAKEPLPLDILINPLSLFIPPGEVKETPKPEASPEEEATVPPTPEPATEAPTEQPAEELVEQPAEQPAEEPVEPPIAEEIFKPAPPPTVETPVVEPKPVVPEAESSPPPGAAKLPSTINAVPVSPNDVFAGVAFGTPVGSKPSEGPGAPPQMNNDEVMVKLSKVAERSIDTAAAKGLELGRQAIELAKALSGDPNQEKDETKAQLDKYRAKRSDLLAAVGIIDRYRLEKYLDITIEQIDKEILAEVRRPYDDLKASPLWEKYREREGDFEDAFALITSHFLNRRSSESIYAGEMAALETHIADYEGVMLEIEELLAAAKSGG